MNDGGKIFMVPSKINDLFFIRFAVCASNTEQSHVDFAWNIVLKSLEQLKDSN